MIEYKMNKGLDYKLKAEGTVEELAADVVMLITMIYTDMLHNDSEDTAGAFIEVIKAGLSPDSPLFKEEKEC